MSVNLIQLQDRLKDVRMQDIMQYANGGNPDVPPFMALSELSRRKRVQQDSQQAQAPQGTVKDKLEQEVTGMAGMAGPGQMPGQQPGQPPQGQPPQGMPQGMPQGAPQMAPPQAPPVRAAEGGLMSLSVPDFKFGSGGIVAFAASGEVGGDGGGDEDDDEDSGSDEGVSMLTTRSIGPQVAISPNADLQRYKALMESRLAERTPTILSPLELEKKLAKEDPEQYAILRAKPGAEYMQGIEAALQARNSEAEKQRAENAKLKELQTYGLLAKAANSTRGMTGGVGSQIAQMLGSFGQGYAGVEEKAITQEQALRDDLLKRQELKNAAQFEVEKLQRARAEGDVKAEYAHIAKLQQLQNALSVSQNSLLKGAVSGAYGVAGKQYAADVAAKAKTDAAITAAKARVSAAYAPGDKQKILNYAEKLRSQGKLAEAEAYLKDAAVLSGGSSGSTRDALRALSDERTGYSDIIKNANGKFTADDIADAKIAYQEVVKEMTALRKSKQPKADEVTPLPADAELPPGMPAGSTFGKKTAKGTEVLKDGKLIGYAN